MAEKILTGEHTDTIKIYNRNRIWKNDSKVEKAIFCYEFYFKVSLNK